MARLLCCIANRHLLDVGSNVEAFDVVGVVKVVAEIVLREVERDEETRVVWREAGCAHHCDRKFGPET